MTQVVAIDGVLCVQRFWNGQLEIIGFFERGGDGWGFVKTAGNQAGGSDTYQTLQQAFNCAQHYTPFTNEGKR